MLTSRVKYLYIFLISLFTCTLAQDKNCFECNKPVSGQYLKVGNKVFHPEHFKCAKCGNLISGSYTYDNGKFFHKNCFYQEIGRKCSKCNKLIEGKYFSNSKGTFHKKCLQDDIPKCKVCGKSIEGKYYQKDGANFHADCYIDKNSLKCSVCSDPLIGKYYVDSHGNKYHQSHKNLFHNCDNCNRIISKTTSSGGKRYADGREICNICYNNSVSGYLIIKELFNSVLFDLEKLGIKVDSRNIKIVPADRNRLRNVARSAYSNAMKGYCSSVIKTTTLNGEKTIEKFFTIYLLDGVPKEYITSTIAHELMHVWLIQNTENNHSPMLTEGSCNYVSSLYLRLQYNKMSNEVIKALENDPDKIYGDGYRRVKMKFQASSVDKFLDYLKNNNHI